MSRASIFQPGNVAVVTGAALGIGRSMAMRFAETGMRVVIADLPGDDFDEALNAIRVVAPDGNRSVTGVAVDVSKPDDISHLRSVTLDNYGKIDFLANNAVTRAGKGFEASVDEWRRAIEVNLWGPVYGVQAFLPDMLSNPGPSAIVNVGSKQGITNPPGHPIYNMSKSALKTYSEALQHQLRNAPDNQGLNHVSCHLLVPGWTTTGKAEHKSGAWLPQQVTARLIEAVSKNDFYIICPDNEVTSDMDQKRIIWAAQDITENRPPLSRWHSDYEEQARIACS